MSVWQGVLSLRVFAAPRQAGEGGSHARPEGRGRGSRRGSQAAEAVDLVAERRGGTIPLIEGRTQAEVLARLRAGDVEALEVIYRTYGEPLSKLGYSLTRSREATKDLVQDLFLAVWERREELDVQDDLGVYLRSALRYRAYKVSRHEAVVRRVEAAAAREDIDVPAMGSVVGPDVALEAAEVERAFAAALDSVSERDRRILTMRWGEGLTHEEIARVLGISRTRVRAIIARQQERLRPFFEMLR